jgi:hypothetical protein
MPEHKMLRKIFGTTEQEVTRGWRNYIMGIFQKFPDLPPGARTTNGTAFCH